MQEWVMLVPGFAASNLWRVDSYGDRRVKIWLSQLDIGLFGIGALDTSPEVSPLSLDRVRPGEILREVYSPLLSTLAKAGIPVYTHAYDWRADVTTNGQRLAEVIEAHVGTQARFTILTHSAGGLIAMDAIHRLSDAALNHVGKLITCACPWRGSYRTLELLAGVHETVLKVAAPSALFGPAPYLRRLADSLRVIASWPGVYDLLPMPEMMSFYPPGEGQDFRTLEFWQRVNPYFDLEEYFRATTRRPIQLAVPPSIIHRNIYGVGKETSGPSPTVVDGQPDHWFRALLGDGTVPEYSAAAPGTLNAIQMPVEAEHEQFMNSDQVRFLLGRVL